MEYIAVCWVMYSMSWAALGYGQEPQTQGAP